jgi:hypothetical protein
MLAGAAFPQPAGWPTVTVVTDTSEPLGPGVTYERWALTTSAGPIVVYVTTVDLRDPHVALGVATHHDVIAGTDEALTSMMDRARAEAAINADYFDIGGSGAPLNVVAAGGRLLHQPDGAAALVVDQDGHVTLGPVTLQATLTDAAGSSLPVNAVNDWGVDDGLSLITPEFGADAGSDLEIVLAPSGPASYKVVAAVFGASHLLPLTRGEFGLVARGAEQVGRLSPFAPGDSVALAFASTPSSIVSAVGGGPLLLRGGSVVNDASAPAPQEANVRYPVTGAGVSADGSTLWLVAVDGRAPARSIGITRPMLGALLASLGASDAMAFDSGGSTEMAIRHLGDTASSVANVPSDGRERSIADALLVINTAAPGPATQALVHTDGALSAVLVGSHLRLSAAAVDAGLQPVAVTEKSASFASDAPAIATIDGDGVLSAIASGRVDVSARIGAVASSPQPIDVVAAPDAVAITGYDRVIESGATARLSILATLKDGRTVAVDSNAVSWASTGDGKVGGDGTFTGGAAAGVASVTARVGSTSVTLPVFVGEHSVMLDAFVDPKSPTTWQFSGSPRSVSGGVDRALAPDRSSGLHLSYVFTQGGATRAAYANAVLAVPGQPLAFSIDVYGDTEGEWLRGGYRNADGIVDSLTLARHVDWRGWKTIRVDVPATARWPIVWTRFYAVESRADAIEAGDLWFRNFAAIEAGPGAAPSPSPVPSPSS